MPLAKNQQITETAAGTNWEKVLDEPTLRRLLRDGHSPAVAVELLTQIEEDV